MSFVFAAIKRGMTQIAKDGAVIPITLLEVVEHDIVRAKTIASDGYNAVCFSAGKVVKDRKVSNPVKVAYAKLSKKVRQFLFESRLPDDMSPAFTKESVDFSFLDGCIGDIVDVTTEKTQGKGFAGVMKRWNFGGLRASHGVSVSHRSHGSTGQRQDPGKVFKGKKMAGHYGAERCTVQGLKIEFFDSELGLLGIKGGVPGSKGEVVFVKTTAKGMKSPYYDLNKMGFIVAKDAA